jgi:C-terminal processing protease CtpA/Prc
MTKSVGMRFAIAAASLCMLLSTTASPSSALTSAHQRVYLKAWKSIKENYYDRNKISAWTKWQHRYDGKLRTREELAHALDTMVDSLSDDYTFVLSDDDVKTRVKQQKSRSVSAARVINGNIGYVKLDTFSGDDVVGDLKRALRTVASSSGVILDLRNNHGGYVSAAQEVFSMLTDEGTFMTYDGYADGSKDDKAFVLKRNGWNVTENGKVTVEHRPPNMLGAKPLVVLVNEDTRSAAEMLSGALRENGRAVILGKQTYGKGVLQDTFDLGEHLVMKVVTAKYYLPDGTNIHEKGIAPDVELDGRGDEQVQRAAQMLSSAIAEAHGSRQRALAVIERAGTSL